MIDINLVQSIPKVRGISSKGDGSKMLVIIAISVLVVALASVFSARTILLFQKNMSSKAKVAGIVTGAKGVSNSSRQEVVAPTKIISSASSSAPKVVAISYSDMGELEKINYEMKMPHTLFREFSEGVSSIVDFRKLQLKDFKTLSGEGVVNSRADAGSMLSFFNGNNWTLAPKPKTLIVKEGSYYRFNFSADYSLSTKNMTLISIKKSDIPDISTLNSIKDMVLKTADESGMNLNSKMELVGSELEGSYNHYKYELSGECSFSSFRLFMAQIYKSAQPIRFKTIKLNAAGKRVKFVTTIVITAA
jgi:hypothetical protein